MELKGIELDKFRIERKQIQRNSIGTDWFGGAQWKGPNQSVTSDEMRTALYKDRMVRSTLDEATEPIGHVTV